VVTNNPCIIVHQNKLHVFEKLNAKRLIPFFEKQVVTIPRSIEEKYYNEFILNTVRDFEVHSTGFAIIEESTGKTAVLSLENNLKYEPCLVLQFWYGNEKFLPNSTRKLAVQLQTEGNNYLFRKVERDFEWESDIQTHLKQVGLLESNGYYSLPALELLDRENALYFLINWINKNKPKLDEREIRITQEYLEKLYYTGSQFLELKTQERGDWFDLHVLVTFGEFTFPFIKLKKYILDDIREFVLPNGEIAILPEEWFARYRGLIPFAKIQGDKLHFEKHYFCC
jgi:hypothetical protein